MPESSIRRAWSSRWSRKSSLLCKPSAALGFLRWRAGCELPALVLSCLAGSIASRWTRVCACVPVQGGEDLFSIGSAFPAHPTVRPHHLGVSLNKSKPFLCRAEEIESRSLNGLEIKIYP